MITITGFADEISPELDTQISVLESEGIRHLEFRGVWGKNVLKLTDEELQTVKDELDRRGIRLSSVGSPIGKIKITEDFERYLHEFDRAIHVAKFFSAPYIRIFSFFITEGEDPEQYRDEMMRRMKVLVHRAEEADVILLHENEKEIYGDTAERCLDIFNACPSAHLRAAFDPANFVQCGVKPFTDAYPLLKQHVEYLHIKDALFAGGNVVPAGEGDGEVREVLNALKASGYEGFMSLEPHLSAAGTFSGFSGPDLFRVATASLKKLLQENGQEWN